MRLGLYLEKAVNETNKTKLPYNTSLWIYARISVYAMCELKNRTRGTSLGKNLLDNSAYIVQKDVYYTSLYSAEQISFGYVERLDLLFGVYFQVEQVLYDKTNVIAQL